MRMLTAFVYTFWRRNNANRAHGSSASHITCSMHSVGYIQTHHSAISIPNVRMAAHFHSAERWKISRKWNWKPLLNLWKIMQTRHLILPKINYDSFLYSWLTYSCSLSLSLFILQMRHSPPLCPFQLCLFWCKSKAMNRHQAPHVKRRLKKKE